MKPETTIGKIRAAIGDLEKKDGHYTYADIGLHCNVSKQRVHYIMKKCGLTTGRTQDSSESYAKQLISMNTSSMTISELANSVGYMKNYSTLRRILKMNGLVCKSERAGNGCIKNRLSTLDTANMTEFQIAHAIGYKNCIASLRAMLKYYNAPYRTERLNCFLIRSLKNKQTKTSTIDELIKVTQYDKGRDAFESLLNWNGIPFRV